MVIIPFQEFIPLFWNSSVPINPTANLDKTGFDPKRPSINVVYTFFQHILFLMPDHYPQHGYLVNFPTCILCCFDMKTIGSKIYQPNSNMLLYTKEEEWLSNWILLHPKASRIAVLVTKAFFLVQTANVFLGLLLMLT